MNIGIQEKIVVVDNWGNVIVQDKVSKGVINLIIVKNVKNNIKDYSFVVEINLVKDFKKNENVDVYYHDNQDMLEDDGVKEEVLKIPEKVKIKGKIGGIFKLKYHVIFYLKIFSCGRSFFYTSIIINAKKYNEKQTLFIY